MPDRIITAHIFPPIPDRRYDWCAYLESEDGLGTCGYGRTENEAIQDLIADLRDLSVDRIC